MEKKKRKPYRKTCKQCGEKYDRQYIMKCSKCGKVICDQCAVIDADEAIFH